MINKKIVFYFLLAILVLSLSPVLLSPKPVHADVSCNDPSNPNSPGCTASGSGDSNNDGGAAQGNVGGGAGGGAGGGGAPTVDGILAAIKNIAFTIAGGVVVILWIITGLLFVTAQGAPDKMNSAKKALMVAIAGTLVVIIAGSAITLVGSAFGL